MTDAGGADEDCGKDGASCRKAGGRRWLPLVLVVLAAAAALAFGLPKYLSAESFLAHRADLAEAVSGNLAVAAASVFLIYSGVVALSIPGGLFLTLVCGFLFGPMLGSCLAILSATTGASLLFLIARTSIGDSLRAKAGPRLARIADGFRADAFSYLLFLRLVPIAPFWLVNLAPALIGIPLRTFVLATVIGITPATSVFATIGAGLDAVIAAQEAANADCLASGACNIRLDPKALLTPEIIAGLLGLGLLSLLPVAVKKWRAKRRIRS